MSLNDKFDALKDKVTGKVKETAGQVTGDEKLEAEGKVEGFMGKAKEGFENIKDKASDVVEDIAEKFNDTVDSIKNKKED